MMDFTIQRLCICLISLFPLLITMGCASNAQKIVMEEFEKADRVYGVVIKKAAADNWRFRGECRDGKVDPSAKFGCEAPDDFEFITSWIMASNHYIGHIGLVSKSAGVEEGNIIRLNLKNRFSAFEGIASKSQTDTCRWEGTPLWVHQSTLLGLVAGIALPPLSLSVFYDGSMLSGVECEGWSYLTYWKNAKEQSSNKRSSLKEGAEKTQAPNSANTGVASGIE